MARRKKVGKRKMELSMPPGCFSALFDFKEIQLVSRNRMDIANSPPYLSLSLPPRFPLSWRGAWQRPQRRGISRIPCPTPGRVSVQLLKSEKAQARSPSRRPAPLPPSFYFSRGAHCTETAGNCPKHFPVILTSSSGNLQIGRRCLLTSRLVH